MIFIFCILLEKTPRKLFEVCAEIEGHREGTSIHCQVHQGECISNIVALNMLLTLYRVKKSGAYDSFENVILHSTLQRQQWRRVRGFSPS